MLNRLQGVFASLNSHDVKYIVIGGVAAVLHGVPRATLDLDILIESSSANARRLLDALLDSQLATAELITPDQLIANEITVFNDRVRIDVQTATPGIKFEEVWERRETMSFQGQPLFVLSAKDLIASKRAAGRSIDLEDADTLDELISKNDK